MPRNSQRKKQRAQQRMWGDNLPAPIRPVRGRKRIGRYITSRVQREFRPVVREMQRQARQLRGTQRAINQAYAGSAQTQRNLANQVLASHQQTAQQYGDLLSNLAQNNQSFADRLAQQQSADAQRRSGLDPSAQTRQTAGQINASQLDVGAAQAQALLAQGQAAHTGLMAGAAADSGRRLQDIGKVRAQRADLRRDRLDLAAKRGEFRNEVLDDLRERERDFYIKHRAFANDAADRRVSMDYNDAMRQQALLGLLGDRATANAMIRAARQHRRGREASARGQERAARIHGRNKNKASQQEVRRGVGIIRERARKFGGTWRDAAKNRAALVDMLLDRGMGLPEARAAVDRYIRQGRRQEQKRRQGLTLPDGRPVQGNTVRR